MAAADPDANAQPPASGPATDRRRWGGASEFARAFAHILLCEAPREMNPCGVCAGCLLLANHNHPDIFILAPEEDSKVIKISQIRALNEFIANTAQQSGRKSSGNRPC